MFILDDVEILIGSSEHLLALRFLVRRNSSCTDFIVRGKERFVSLIQVYWSNAKNNTLEHRLAAGHPSEEKLHNRTDEFVFHTYVMSLFKEELRLE